MKTVKKLKRVEKLRISEKKYAFWTIAFSMVMNAGTFIHVSASLLCVLFYIFSIIAYFRFIRRPNTLKRTSALYIVILTLANLFSLFAFLALVLAFIMAAFGHLDFQELLSVI